MGEGWLATNLRPDTRGGLGAWSVDEIVEYLKTGANDHARALGPMAEVVHNSTMYLSQDDLRAMATYLKALPAANGDNATAALGANDPRMVRGRHVYVDQCAACHMEDGAGIPGVFPPVKGNSGVQSHDPASIARLVLEGAPSVKTPVKPEGFAMPAFGWKLDDQQVADLLTYIRSSWGNSAPAVEASKISDERKEVAKTS
jgi:mono/diheme cytochrome c family protein